MNKQTRAKPSPAFTSSPELAGTIHQSARGRFRVSVVDAKTGDVLEKRPWQENLILDSGLDLIASQTWASQLVYAVAGTSNTPTKDLATGGTYSQLATTVTRDTGTRDFISGDVGKLIKWTSGQTAKITALIGVTSVTVSTSQTVVAGALDAIYRVAQTGLGAEVKRTLIRPEFTDVDDSLPATYTSFDAALGTIKLKVTLDFSEEVGSVNYTEIGMSSSATVASNLFSRMLLAGAVTVSAGQLLRLKYELTITTQGAVAATQTTIDGGITGWPLPYNISSIVSNGSFWDVTLAEPHHFLAAGKFNIAGALRPKLAITVAASTVSDFTITAAGHGRIGGDSITIEGMTPSGYNGTFTVASVAGNDIVVTSVLNPGVGTLFGTVRQTTPATWYNGTDYTIASIPSASVVRITNATSIAAAGASGTAYNNTKRKYIAVNSGVAPASTGASYGSRTAAVNKALSASWDNSFFTYYEGAIEGSTSPTAAGILLVAPGVLPVVWPKFWLSTYSLTTAGVSLSTTQSPTNTSASTSVKVGQPSAYVAGNHYEDTTLLWAAGDANSQLITIIGIGINRLTSSAPDLYTTCQGYFLFEEPQRKKSTYKLSLTFRRSWGRDLTTIPL